MPHTFFDQTLQSFFGQRVVFMRPIRLFYRYFYSHFIRTLTTTQPDVIFIVHAGDSAFTRPTVSFLHDKNQAFLLHQNSHKAGWLQVLMERYSQLCTCLYTVSCFLFPVSYYLILKAKQTIAIPQKLNSLMIIMGESLSKQHMADVLFYQSTQQDYHCLFAAIRQI